MEGTAIEKKQPSVTDAQVKKWKKQYGKVFKFECDDKAFFFRKPDMKIMSAVTKMAQSDELRATQLYFQNCLLNQGLVGFKDDVDVMMSISPHLQGLIKQHSVTVTEL